MSSVSSIENNIVVHAKSKDALELILPKRPIVSPMFGAVAAKLPHTKLIKTQRIPRTIYSEMISNDGIPKGNIKGGVSLISGHYIMF